MSIARRRFLALAAASAAAGCAHTLRPSEPSLGDVRRLSPALDALIAPDAAVEELASGFRWAEGPLWVRRGEYLLFSDVPGNTIYRWSRAHGVTAFLHPSGYAGADASQLREGGANGLALDAGGALLMCDSGNRALARLDLATRRKEILVDRFLGKRFNSPNDLCRSRSGAIYFTDPSFGLAGLNDSPVKELPFNGVFRLAPDGTLALVDDTLSFPNGIALSSDESLLYVSNCDGKNPIIRAYRLGAHGMPKNSSTMFDASPLLAPDAPGWPDGIKLDAAGNLFAAGPGGILVIASDGSLLGVIGAGRAISNCAFGEGGRTLFLTAKDRLGRVRLRTRGAGWA